MKEDTMSNNCPSKTSLRITKIIRKRVFAKFVKSKLVDTTCVNDDSIPSKTPSWLCCGEVFSVATEIHKHVAKCHSEAVDHAATFELQKGNHDRKRRKVCGNSDSPKPPCQPAKSCSSLANNWLSNSENLNDCRCILSDDNELHLDRQHAHISMQVKNSITSADHDAVNSERMLPWLPSLEECQNLQRTGNGQILLYYKYVDILDPTEVADWQRELCQRLQLTGKIRLATEGMNGTVGGSTEATEHYIKAVMAHPLFKDMTSLDFKKSTGDSSHFPNGLKVGVHQEIVPMGVDPEMLSYRQAGTHLTPSEFHREIEHHLESETEPGSKDTLFLDCRNFYESKIGQFKGAVTPNIRKFSYWPEYVDRNLDLFQDKRVVMYCTGGIRCERGSAYLKSKGICKEVLQLRGGIHKYIDEYPDGHFRGKLFVFDDRYAITTNDDIIANCFHCGEPWDQYHPCSSAHCHQLVLACPGCRAKGQTACCKLCIEMDNQVPNGGRKIREECLCTRRRERVPLEK